MSETLEMPKAKDVFNECLSAAFGTILKQMPQNKARIADALLLVESGKVVIEGEYSTVKSQKRDEQEYQFAKGEQCPCEDARNKAPNSWCKHKIADLMYRRAADASRVVMSEAEQAILAQEVPETGDEPPPDEEQTGGMGMSMSMSDEEAEAFAAQMDEKNALLDAENVPQTPGTTLEMMEDTPSQIEQTNFEPHSFTIKGVTNKGFEVLACVRGHDVEQIIKDTERTLKWMVERNFRGNYATNEEVEQAKVDRTAQPPKATQTTANQDAHNAHNEANNAAAQAQTERCDYHNMDMVSDNKMGRVRWSHKVGNKWCQGNWCEAHDQTFYKNERKDGTGYFWSHKDGQGNYCNPPRED